MHIHINEIITKSPFLQENLNSQLTVVTIHSFFTVGKFINSICYEFANALRRPIGQRQKLSKILTDDFSFFMAALASGPK